MFSTDIRFRLNQTITHSLLLHYSIVSNDPDISNNTPSKYTKMYNIWALNYASHRINIIVEIHVEKTVYCKNPAHPVWFISVITSGDMLFWARIFIKLDVMTIVLPVSLSPQSPHAHSPIMI
jgi:hypothetical protein